MADDHPRIAAIKAATKKFEAARIAVERAIFDAYADATVKRTEITDASPWTPGHTRKLARDHGIKADPAYQQRAETTRRRAAQAATPPPASTVPEWLSDWPQIAALTPDEARERAGELERDRPEWFQTNRKLCRAEPPWLNYAMLAAAANDPEAAAE
ncbi:hypothetical protein [Streptacidiphilus cavernicola]|uniref:Uncharacterized protein n=1 Tax=Streptacidiphilus cavernicola TaxID=3342716 RepID=A0ABV6W459_9ACTN